MSEGNISGVKSYIDGKCEVVVHFPVDWRGVAYLDCMHCPHYSTSSHRCKLNNSVPAFPEKYIGQECPLEISLE